MDLTFIGYVSGHVDRAVNVRPVVTGTSYDYEPDAWTTQCAVKPADDGAWEANLTVQLKGITWQITIDERGFGSPAPGHHEGVPSIGSGAWTDEVLGIDVMSNKSPDGFDNGSTTYGYYTPIDRNNAQISLNPGLTSGTLDIWLTPDVTAGYEFHVTGRWSCAP